MLGPNSSSFQESDLDFIKLLDVGAGLPQAFLKIQGYNCIYRGFFFPSLRFYPQKQFFFFIFGASSRIFLKASLERSSQVRVIYFPTGSYLCTSRVTLITLVWLKKCILLWVRLCSLTVLVKVFNQVGWSYKSENGKNEWPELWNSSPFLFGVLVYLLNLHLFKNRKNHNDVWTNEFLQQLQLHTFPWKSCDVWTINPHLAADPLRSLNSRLPGRVGSCVSFHRCY